MRCWRLDLRRNFSLYLGGELSARKVKRIEDHLLDCGWCRARLAHIRGGHRFAQAAPRFAPRRDPWAAIEAAIEAEQNRTLARPELATAGLRTARLARVARRQMLKPSFVIVFTAAVILACGLWVASDKRATPGGQAEASHPSDSLDLREFRTVSIGDMERTTTPHVVAEGYVSEVRINDEDGDLSFRLVDSLQQSEPFIICEIIDPIRLAPPSVGSRVRVYGVSRYDSQENHNWYEVHPVLNIEVVRD
ncbi:MAG TPA: zf-HC2 domain-containing protein [Blastocatellia bacterium]|jgi:anti-sigma factor RsiW|nr:zf-HC2 domain-containing protein [Blastocatellia bacterium]